MVLRWMNGTLYFTKIQQMRKHININYFIDILIDILKTSIYSTSTPRTPKYISRNSFPRKHIFHKVDVPEHSRFFFYTYDHLTMTSTSNNLLGE